MSDRSIEDLMGEALRRHRLGLIRPLWADMPEGDIKRGWRKRGMALLLDRAGAREPDPEKKSA
jgi:hypothetical protein